MINSKLMKKFMAQALKNLNGQWIIIGGTVLPMMGVDHRPTIDIDFINLEFSDSMEQTLKLMAIVESLDLPVETINQAGAYFLSKISNVNKHLVLLDKSKKCEVYRPDAYLFIKLKITRMSESDLLDCLEFMKRNKIEVQAHKAAIKKEIAKSMKRISVEKEQRLKEILHIL